MKSILILFTTALFCASSFISFSQEEDYLNLVVIGSSTAAGYGTSVKDSAWVNRYRTYLQDYHPFNEVHNLAKGGYSTYQLMPTSFDQGSNRPYPDPKRNISAALALNPDVIIVNLPSNDVSSGYSVKEQMDNFQVMIDSAEQQGVEIFICTTQPRNFIKKKKRKTQYELFEKIQKEYGHRVIDFWSTIATKKHTIDRAYNSGDGTHLNDSGHKILFDRVVEREIFGNLTEYYGSDEKYHFEDSSILMIPFVNPEACDYPYNLSMFYDFDEYEELKYTGFVDEGRLIAKRTWTDEEYNKETVEFKEEIRVFFGDMGSYRRIAWAQIIQTASMHDKTWTVHKSTIDYRGDVTMNYQYQMEPDTPIMKLSMTDPSVENIDFLRNLCYFYQNENHKNVKFEVEEE